MNYYPKTRLLHSFCKKLQIAVSFTFVAMLIGCADEPEETTSIATKDILLSVAGRIFSSNNSRIVVGLYDMRRNGDARRLRLGSGERLALVIDGVKKSLQELRDDSDPYAPKIYYYYAVIYTDNIAGKNINLRFERASGIDALNTRFNFGASPTILTPNADDTFSITGDDIVVEWLADTIPGGSTAVTRRYCGVLEFAELSSDDQTMVIFSADPTAQLTCDDGTAEIQVSRWHRDQGVLDPALYQGTNPIFTSVNQSVQINLTQ